MRKYFPAVIALISVFALLMGGCGGKEAAEATTVESLDAPALGVKEFSLSTSTWSSPNGATVHLTAIPYGYAVGHSASFVVMLEDEEVANEPCVWDGIAYTASAELNAADGLHYYIRMQASEHDVPVDFPVNTPDQTADEALIHLASSLESYCHVLVEDSAFADGRLTLASGSVQVQTPRITNNGETITVSEATLALTFNAETVDSQSLVLSAGADGVYALELKDISFVVPRMENDQQLTLMLSVSLSNGQTLQAMGGTFFYNDGALLAAVG